jgi:DNA-binding transcriptional ArsR family regulator
MVDPKGARRQSRQSRFQGSSWPCVIAQLQSYVRTMQAWEIEQAAHRFALLGDPTRLRILHTVMENGEAPVHRIAELASASRFNTSAHLNRLASAGLVARRREGSTVFYRVDDEQLPLICQSMCASLRARARGAASAV